MEYYESIDRYSKFINMGFEDENYIEMRRYFDMRTNSHIGRVRDFLEILKDYFPSYDDELNKRKMLHDASKFRNPELIPYVYLTWRYKERKEGRDIKYSNEMERNIHSMTFHHCKNNSHHPEYWDDNLVKNPINFKDRDKPSGIVVDGSKMDDISIMEMVCDWSSMSVEHGEDSPRGWADNNIGKRWKFSKGQEELIYEIIDILW